jgi:hypothetical protein
MSLAVTFEDGTGEMVRVEGERFAMVASRAFAPGTPLAVALGGDTLQLKVARSARRDDGRFDVEGRLVNLTRAQRALLAPVTSDRSPSR